MRRFCCWLMLLGFSAAWLAGPLRADPVFNPENFPGAWTLATNEDGSVWAGEAAIHRQGRTVFCRALDLQADPGLPPPVNPGAPTEQQIHQFIQTYRPPPVPYTSEQMALKTGREKFNCLEFAAHLVRTALARHIPAQIIGIKFQGEWAGHAVAGFPADDGQELYFDSTPGNGQLSRAADEAQVVVGQPYTRAGGGELDVVGRRPISEVIPVTPLPQLDAIFAAAVHPGPAASPVIWRVARIRWIPAGGIDYADTNSLQISNAQAARWSHAAAAGAGPGRVLTSDGRAAAARALAENEALAAQNDPCGQLRMGERYLQGDGVPKNPALGRGYLRQAADQGSPTAQRELAAAESAAGK